jgi:hypothetical protein
MSVEALRPKPMNPRLVSKIAAPKKPACFDHIADPSQNIASAVINAHRADPSRAAVSLIPSAE